MSYNIDKNTRLYYVWTIRYDKYHCTWSDLSSSTTASRGKGEWTSTSNYRFLVLTYHQRTANDSTQPDLPSDLNYPGYPPNSYCNMQYIKWRVVRSESYTGEPFQVSYVSSQGDDWWRQVTPFEYELTQSVPMFCATTPQPPSFSNTIMKYDSSNTYRKFRSRWSCSTDGSVTYVSGPTYVSNVKERGNSRWEYHGKSFSDALLGVVYEIEWTSSTKGIGTSPQSIISDELRSTLAEFCDQPASSSAIALSDSKVSLSERNLSEQTYSGYPIYRVVYDCSEKTFGDVELAALDQEDNQLRTNNWEYVDIYEESGINKCVFYYYSSGYQTNIKYANASALTKPAVTDIDLYECPCYWMVDVNKVLEATEFMTVVVSGVEGRASSINSVYELPKIEGENLWKLENSTTSIVLKYTSDVWDFSFSKKYEGNNRVLIDKLIQITDSFIGNFRVIFSESAEFTDEDGIGSCALSFEGNTLEDYIPPPEEPTEESSSSSSSSSSDSGNEGEATDQTTAQADDQEGLDTTAGDDTQAMDDQFTDEPPQTDTGDDTQAMDDQFTDETSQTNTGDETTEDQIEEGFEMEDYYGPEDPEPFEDPNQALQE